jgi:molybdenum cofactor cytidylyltransferase
VDIVVVVVGLSGLGQPLDSTWVHRPELFADLSGLSLGEPVTPSALVKLLTNPRGGLKSIPAGARRIVLLNQAEIAERQSAANHLVKPLLSNYHAVLVAALAVKELPLAGRQDLSLHDRGPVIVVREPVAGIILAAGSSSRLGGAKQVLLWRGQPLVRHVAIAALAAGLSPVIIVTGSMSSQVEAAVSGLPIALAYNPAWQAGQSTSLVAGLQFLPPETGSVIFLLADQPQVPANLLQALVDLHAETLSPLVAPQVQGRRANPVLFDRQTFPDLLTLSGDVGGRALFSHYNVAWLPWHDTGLILDVDTPEDYQRLLELE